MKVSVITPTYNRQNHLRNALRAFQRQTYKNKEWLIYDDSPTPMQRLQVLSKREPNIHYIHTPDRCSIGIKRNLLIERAQGELIINFDDDDYFAPTYIQTMVEFLGKHDFFSLNGWYVYGTDTGFFGYWYTPEAMDYHYIVAPRNPVEILEGATLDTPGNLESFAWGYGFSYIYRKRVCDRVQCDDMNFAEDYSFAKKVKAAGFKMHMQPDRTGIILHMIHACNSSRIFPQYRLPSFLLPQVFGRDIMKYEFIQASPF